MSFRCQIACLELFDSLPAPTQKGLTLNELTFLLQHEGQENPDLRGRILIVEDLTRDVIELLGSSLNIDPFFFASHIDVFLPEVATPRPYMAALPSVTSTQNFVNLHYHRVLTVDSTLKRTLNQNSNVPRKVKILPPFEDTHIGLARHCCSILKTTAKDGLWLGKDRVFYDGQVDLHTFRAHPC